MRKFIKLYMSVDQTSSTLEKVELLSRYFNEVGDKDKVWMIALIIGRRPKRVITTSLLREWAGELAGIENWLIEESYKVVGDRVETLSKIIPVRVQDNNPITSLATLMTLLTELKSESDETKKRVVIDTWSQLNADGRFLFNKLITGGFRIELSQKTLVKALSKLINEEESIITYKLMRCLLYTSPSPRDQRGSRMPSSA